MGSRQCWPGVPRLSLIPSVNPLCSCLGDAQTLSRVSLLSFSKWLIYSDGFAFCAERKVDRVALPYSSLAFTRVYGAGWAVVEGGYLESYLVSVYSAINL